MPLVPKHTDQFNEQARLEVSQSYDIFYSDNEQILDDLTKLGAYSFGIPMALITFIDDEGRWFKSRIGLDGFSSTRIRYF